VAHQLGEQPIKQLGALQDRVAGACRTTGVGPLAKGGSGVAMSRIDDHRTPRAVRDEGQQRKRGDENGPE
jgi:hypothetical protein